MPLVSCAPYTMSHTVNSPLAIIANHSIHRHPSPMSTQPEQRANIACLASSSRTEYEGGHIPAMTGPRPAPPTAANVNSDIGRPRSAVAGERDKNYMSRVQVRRRIQRGGGEDEAGLAGKDV